jgi:uncharacterized membrane protein
MEIYSRQHLQGSGFLHAPMFRQDIIAAILLILLGVAIGMIIDPDLEGLSQFAGQ